jgi:NAD(P)-dependent dehydrogenase (short-subunit alcohol dehydrogenase family)
MDLGLKDNVALVTGASGGIGRGIARALAAEGARVVIHYHNNRQSAEKLQKELPVESLVVGADLKDEAQVQRLFDETIKKWGRLDVLVANAGISPHDQASVKDIKTADWDLIFQTNTRSVFFCAREFMKITERQKGGRMVIISSTAGKFGEAYNAAYAAAKSALYAFMCSLKNEIVKLAPYAAVNIVGPGWTLTGMMDGSDPAVLKRSFQTRAIAWEVPRPEDIASLVVFLSSDKCARFISGQAVYVDGGMEGRVIHSPGELGALDEFFAKNL